MADFDPGPPAVVARHFAKVPSYADFQEFFWYDWGPVFYRGPHGEVRRAERAEFRRLAQAGEVDADTVVFDTTLTRVGGLRDGSWERPAREAWHRQAFFRGQPS